MFPQRDFFDKNHAIFLLGLRRIRKAVKMHFSEKGPLFNWTTKLPEFCRSVTYVSFKKRISNVNTTGNVAKACVF